MTLIRDGPKFLNAKNITEANDELCFCLKASCYAVLNDEQITDHWLVYTNGGDAILVLASNAIHFLWKWPKDLNSGGVATPKVHPNLWKPRSG
ncbi:unnamed protein product [Prunus armeniaca]